MFSAVTDACRTFEISFFRSPAFTLNSRCVEIIMSDGSSYLEVLFDSRPVQRSYCFFSFFSLLVFLCRLLRQKCVGVQHSAVGRGVNVVSFKSCFPTGHMQLYRRKHLIALAFANPLIIPYCNDIHGRHFSL